MRLLLKKPYLHTCTHTEDYGSNAGPEMLTAQTCAFEKRAINLVAELHQPTLGPTYASGQPIRTSMCTV